jgi:thiol-disulfide isomerase/thioredoxin
MIIRIKMPVYCILLAMILTACGSTKAQQPAITQSAMPEQPTKVMMDHATPEAMMEQSTPEAMADQTAQAPSFFTTALTDVNTGQKFTIADWQGKVVLVENMAVWCTTCLRQQGQIQALHGLLGARDDLVSLSLDIDPNEDMEDLKAYTTGHGFSWVYAVAPQEIAREIGQLYGDQFLNPPSAPIFVIDRGGAVHLLPFGVKSAEDLRKALEPLLSEGM